MSARLVPLKAGAGVTIPVQRPVVLIGRHPECDVRIDLPKISRRHCCFAQVYERIVVRDLGSRNGLRVNGRLVDEVQLHDGDEVAIGPLLYRVELDVPAALPPRRRAAAGASPARARAGAGASARARRIQAAQPALDASSRRRLGRPDSAGVLSECSRVNPAAHDLHQLQFDGVPEFRDAL